MTHLLFLETAYVSSRLPDPGPHRIVNLPDSAAARAEIEAMLAAADMAEAAPHVVPRVPLRARLRAWVPEFGHWLRSMPLP